jgi:hypothetical protein
MLQDVYCKVRDKLAEAKKQRDKAVVSCPSRCLNESARFACSEPVPGRGHEVLGEAWVWGFLLAPR